MHFIVNAEALLSSHLYSIHTVTCKWGRKKGCISNVFFSQTVNELTNSVRRHSDSNINQGASSVPTAPLRLIRKDKFIFAISVELNQVILKKADIHTTKLAIYTGK